MKKFITNVNPKSYKSTAPKGLGEKHTITKENYISLNKSDKHKCGFLLYRHSSSLLDSS